MKLIIAGSRHLSPDVETIQACIDYHYLERHITEIVSGTALGVDKAGEWWARENGVLLGFFPADWDQYGKAAGPIRNKQMADYADALLIIWDGKSHGSANMIKTMAKMGKPVYEISL